jgi:hypothetical protein
VVADAEVKTSLAMPRINLGDRTGLVGPYCRTMDYYQGYSAHAWTKKVDAISDPTATRNLIILPTVFLLNFIILLSNFKLNNGFRRIPHPYEGRGPGVG